MNEFQKEMMDKLISKNSDYAGDEDPLFNLRRHGAYGVSVRLDDKISRLAVLDKAQTLPNNESIADTEIDTAVYAFLHRVLREEGTIRLPAAKPSASVYIPDGDDIKLQALARGTGNYLSKECCSHFNIRLHEPSGCICKPQCFCHGPEGVCDTPIDYRP
jgi:hypothetical protein